MGNFRKKIPLDRGGELDVQVHQCKDGYCATVVHFNIAKRLPEVVMNTVFDDFSKAIDDAVEFAEGYARKYQF